MAHDDRGHAAAALFEQELGELGDLAPGQPREHLVEQERPGAGGEGAGELELAKLAHRELARVHRGLALAEPHAPDDLPVGPLRRAFGEEPPDAVRHHADPDVVEHRHLAEGARDLPGAGDAAGDPAVGRHPRHVLAAEEHPSRVGPLLAHEEPERGGLAGAVRADEPERLALVHVHAQPVHRDEPAEALRHLPELEQGGGGHGEVRGEVMAGSSQGHGEVIARPLRARGRGRAAASRRRAGRRGAPAAPARRPRARSSRR